MVTERVLAPHQQRVVDEKNELDHKITSLIMFINPDSAIFVNLSKDEQSRLRRQRAAMMTYSNILGERIAAF